MLYKTKGIVINYIRYRETSIITKIYTEKFGIQSYIENGVRSNKGKNKIALFQPLSILDLVLYHDDKKEIHRISEIKSNYLYQSLPYDVYKSTIGIFLIEILNKTLKEQLENPALFNFLYHSLVFLDETNANFENFHLIFMLKYSFFLGFLPRNAEEIAKQFDELNVNIPFDKSYQSLLNQLIAADYQTPVLMSREVRNHLLEVINTFYKIHVAEFGEIKSLHILRELLN